MLKGTMLPVMVTAIIIFTIIFFITWAVFIGQIANVKIELVRSSLLKSRAIDGAHIVGHCMETEPEQDITKRLRVCKVKTKVSYVKLSRIEGEAIEFGDEESGLEEHHTFLTFEEDGKAVMGGLHVRI